MNSDDGIYQDLLGKIDGVGQSLMLLLAVLEKRHGLDEDEYTQVLRTAFRGADDSVRQLAAKVARHSIADHVDQARKVRQSGNSDGKSQSHTLPVWMTEQHFQLAGKALLEAVLAQQLGARSLAFQTLGAVFPAKTLEESGCIQDLIGWLDDEA